MMYGYGFGNHMLLFMIFIIILMISIFKDSSSGKNSKHSETPIELLKIRYAKGEITEKEYQEIKQELY